MKQTPLRKVSVKRQKAGGLQYNSTFQRPGKQSQKPRKPLPKISKKRKSQQKIYTELTRPAVIKRDQGKCVKCGNPGTDVHHIWGRVGRLYLAVWASCLLCRECHSNIHDVTGERVFREWIRENRPEQYSKYKGVDSHDNYRN